MKRKKKMKDAVSLKAQAVAHEKLAENGDIEVKEETRTYWRNEATGYQRELDEIIGGQDSRRAISKNLRNRV